MKQVSTLIFLTVLSMCSFAQTKNTPLDKSPMDICYYPANYPVLKIQNKVKEPVMARIIYSRPQKAGRTVFGELVEYDKVWRLGANEATELELYTDATVGNSKLKKGRYTMYAVPEKQKWSIIFNRETDTWGAFQYDQKKDAIRIDINPETSTDIVEAFSMNFEKKDNKVNLVISWDNQVALVPFNFNASK